MLSGAPFLYSAALRAIKIRFPSVVVSLSAAITTAGRKDRGAREPGGERNREEKAIKQTQWEGSQTISCFLVNSLAPESRSSVSASMTDVQGATDPSHTFHKVVSVEAPQGDNGGRKTHFRFRDGMKRQK